MQSKNIERIAPAIAMASKSFGRHCDRRLSLIATVYF